MPHEHHGSVLHWARLYDLGDALRFGRLRPGQRLLLERAAIAPGEHVLDVGCGPGRLTREVARRVGPPGRALGIDPSPEMIALARKKGGAEFEQAGIQAIPAGEGAFDVAFASLVLHHVPGELQGKGMDEVRRVLRPGGRFVALDFAASSAHGLGHFLAARFGLKRGSAHAEQLRALFAGAGFADVQVELAPPGYCVIAARKPR